MSFLKLRTGAPPSTPPAGAVEFWASTDKRLHYIDETGAQGPVGGGPSNWVNVTQQATPVLTTNTAAQNVTAINAILAAATNGQTIYFPAGTYLFNAIWTMPAVSLTFRGEGYNGPGGFTNLQWTANVGATFITLSALHWYTTFINLSFSTTVNQTTGYVVDVNGNVGINFYGCDIQGSAAATFLNGINYGGSNGGNTSFVDYCTISGFTGIGINVNSNGSSLIVNSTVIQGQWGTATQCATAGISGQQVGALQVDNCDVIGAINNMLLNPGSGQVCASVFVTNTYFDNSLGSCISISGAGATVRTKFIGCSFTTSSAGAGSFSAFQIAGSYAFTVAGAQAVDLLGCSILNTFGTTGTTNGILCTNGADVNVQMCRIAGWTNGLQITPIASVTALLIEGNFIGSNGGYGVNTVGILLNAGTYLSQTIVGNNLMNSTTPITDNSTVTTTANNNRRIQNNTGFNPKSVVAQPAMPASTTAVFNSTGVDCAVYLKGGTVTAITVGGVVTGDAASSATGALIWVAANQSIAITYSVAPTWVWVGN